MENHFPGLDYDFLRYMGVLPENQRRIQSHYLPYFEQCRQVVDLACGDADFVELLAEQGIEVVGVDNDEKAFAAAEAKGLPVVKADVFDWLAAQPEKSVDGVFSAHLIEHLPFPKVIELAEQAYRILQPGGVILLATPNARSLFSHLEMFYTHFGHITFYHPRLVSFFLDRAGFENAQSGENPETASPLLFNLRQSLVASSPLPPEPWNEPPLPNLLASEQQETAPLAVSETTGTSAWNSMRTKTDIGYQREVPVQGKTPFHYLSYWVKRSLTRWLVQPLLDSLAQNVQAHMERQANQNEQRRLELVSRLEKQLTNTHIRQLYALMVEEHRMRLEQVSALRGVDRELYQRLQIFGVDIQSLNGPFESYTWAYKPRMTGESNDKADGEQV